MLEYLHLQNVGPAPEMELELAPRLNLVTGDNGLGKSFLLDVAWGVLNPFYTSIKARPDPETATEPRITADNGGSRFTLRFDFKEQVWDTGGTIGLDSDVVLYAKVDGCFSIWDRAKDPLVHLDRSEVFDGLEWNGRTLCNGLIRDVVTWQDRENDQIKALAKALERLSPHPSEVLRFGKALRVSPADAREIPTLILPYGRVPVDIAPAGMRRILSLAYLLVWAWSEHRAATAIRRQDPARNLVLLIDEIESHLHPQWQRVILPALIAVVTELAPEVQLQLIVTTHSPLVLASAEPFFDPAQDAWFDLDLDQTTQEVQIEKRDFQRHGDVSSWLVSDAFDLGSARSLAAEQVLEEAAVALSDPAFDRERAREIDTKLRRVLGPLDPFWMRWRFVGERKGWLPEPPSET